MSTIKEVEKVVYTAKIHTTGGRDGGTAQSNDDRLTSRCQYRVLEVPVPIRSSSSRPAGRPVSKGLWELPPAS